MLWQNWQSVIDTFLVPHVMSSEWGGLMVHPQSVWVSLGGGETVGTVLAPGAPGLSSRRMTGHTCQEGYHWPASLPALVPSDGLQHWRGRGQSPA